MLFWQEYDRNNAVSFLVHQITKMMMFDILSLLTGGHNLDHLVMVFATVLLCNA